MPQSRAAKRYAKALFDSVKSGQDLDAVAADLNGLNETLAGSKELQLFVADPISTKDSKKSAITKLFEGRLNPAIVKYLKFLIDKRRLNLLGEICEVFNELYITHKNIAEVEITSAFPLDAGQIERIAQQLKQKLRKDIRSNVTVDPALIGGFKVKAADEVYDFSLRSQLDKFRQGIRTI